MKLTERMMDEKVYRWDCPKCERSWLSRDPINECPTSWCHYKPTEQPPAKGSGILGGITGGMFSWPF
jgi:hypothetical protein